jgi:hypothetical protein
VASAALLAQRASSAAALPGFGEGGCGPSVRSSMHFGEGQGGEREEAR